VLSVLWKGNSFLGDAQMNKDNFEGGVRSAVGQGERFVGAATDDNRTPPLPDDLAAEDESRIFGRLGLRRLPPGFNAKAGVTAFAEAPQWP
jgi:hypothetical protein